MHSTYPKFTEPNPESEERITQILGTLTLEEKISLVGGTHPLTRALPEKGIPAFVCGDGPLGVHRAAETVGFPATIGLAASWDRDLAHRYGESLGREARAAGLHYSYGPAMNLYRSPLCGRNFEYLGEDPYLAGEMAAAYTRGLQSQGVCSVPKHFALNFQEYNRYFVSTDVDERALREVYLRHFEKVIKDGGSGGIMSAYNRLNGEWCAEHHRLLVEILKEEWGFQGVVISDYVSVHDPLAAAKGGLDLEMPRAWGMTVENLVPAIQDGRLEERVIEDKVRRLLRVALCFGWFDDPDRSFETRESDALAGAALNRDLSGGKQKQEQEQEKPESTRKALEAALEIARGSIVLLKNQGLLPLDPQTVRRIAVIGPNADPAVAGGGGSSYVKNAGAVSVLQAVKEIAEPEGVEVTFAKGLDLGRQDHAFNTCKLTAPDGSQGLLGEFFGNLDLEGDPVHCEVNEHINLFWMTGLPHPSLDKEKFSARWTGSLTAEEAGDHTFYFSGGDGEYRVQIGEEMLLDNWNRWHSGARRVRMPLEAGKTYQVRIDYRPTWRFNWVQFGWEPTRLTRPDAEKVEQIAAAADLVIYACGHSRYTEGENWDRTFEMPEEAEELLMQVTAANPRTVVVLNGGGNIDMRRWIHRVRGLLHAWYPGTVGNRALAEILFGRTNPSGKLPATFEYALEDRSSHDNYHDPDGDLRVKITDGVFFGYRNVDRGGKPPLFPFGFGLSYTTFAYENLRLNEESIGAGESLTVSFDIVNTGDRAGAESAQVYIGDPESRLPRPVKELKDFQKTYLEPGERKTLTVELNEEALKYFDPAQGWVVEPGTFHVLIGASSADIRLSGSFQYRE